MRKKLSFVFILILLLGGVCWWYFAGENKTQSTAKPSASIPVASEKLQVVTSGYVPYALARKIGGDQINLSMLVPPGTEPHHFEPTPGSIIAVQKADVFIYVSAQIEPWVTDILQGLSGVSFVAAGPAASDTDPHVWMTPQGALSMAKRIERALSKADPSRQSYFRENLNRFEKQMQQLHRDFADGLAHCQSREVVHIGHLAFGALADAYELDLHALSGSSHQGEHSVHKLTDMVRLVRGHHITAIFTEELISPQLSRTVSEETRARILPLYTIEEVSKEDFEQGISYEEYI